MQLPIYSAAFVPVHRSIPAVLCAELGDRGARVRVRHARVDAAVGGAPDAPLDLEGGEHENIGDKVDVLLVRVPIEKPHDRVLIGRVLNKGFHLVMGADHLPPLGLGGVARFVGVAVLLEEDVDDALECRFDFGAGALV
ncbi:hypothetical protein PG984_013728 [Apiospora sp. TS-2023a]